MELSREETDELQEAFDLFDRDGDGKIGLDELGSVLSLLGQTAQRDDLVALLNAADQDNNGVIDRDEFVGLMRKHLYTADSRPSEEAEMAAAFKVLDRDGDGLIGPDELRAALVSMGERIEGGEGSAEIEAMIQAADKNGDGKIDFDEFVAVLKE